MDYSACVDLARPKPRIRYTRASRSLSRPPLNWPQVEREFEVVVSLGAVSVTSFVVCAILFFWAKFGQSVKHFDPNFASRPPLHLSSAPASRPLERTRACHHTPRPGTVCACEAHRRRAAPCTTRSHAGGLGGYQHHWASSFEHGNKINAVSAIACVNSCARIARERPSVLTPAPDRSKIPDSCVQVRDMPTAIFLTLMMLTFLYAMYLVKQYLNRRVFYVPRRKIVRGTWAGIEREAPDGRRPVDAPGRLAVGEGRARRDRSEARPARAADGRGDGVDPRRWARRGVGFRRLVEEG